MGMCSYMKILSSWLHTGHTWFTPERKAWSDRELLLSVQVTVSSLSHLLCTSSLLFPAFVVWHCDPCLANGDLMPKVWSAQLTMELTERPAVCLSALSEASQTLKDTHFIDISGTWNLCGHGTCVGRGAKLQVAPQGTELLNIPIMTDSLFLKKKI